MNFFKAKYEPKLHQKRRLSMSIKKFFTKKGKKEEKEESKI